MFFRRFEGFSGEITVPSIGLTIATISSWKVMRREESASGETGGWTLHAVCSYINTFAFNEPSLTKQIILSIGKRKGIGRSYRLTWNEASKVALNGRGLIIEGAQIEPWPLQ